MGLSHFYQLYICFYAVLFHRAWRSVLGIIGFVARPGLGATDQLLFLPWKDTLRGPLSNRIYHRGNREGTLPAFCSNTRELAVVRMKPLLIPDLRIHSSCKKVLPHLSHSQTACSHFCSVLLCDILKALCLPSSIQRWRFKKTTVLWDRNPLFPLFIE